MGDCDLNVKIKKIIIDWREFMASGKLRLTDSQADAIAAVIVVCTVVATAVFLVSNA